MRSSNARHGDDHARHSGISAFGQWRGIYRKRIASLVERSWRGAALHRAGQSLGEWLLRKFQRQVRDECLNGEIFYSLREAQIVIEQWRIEYNTRRPHSALGYRPPAPAAVRAPESSTSTTLHAI